MNPMNLARIAALLCAAGAAAERLHVVGEGQAADGVTTFATLNEAIAAADTGDTIAIAAGRHTASVSTQGKELLIEGSGGRTVLVPEPAAAGNRGEPVIHVPEAGAAVQLVGLRFESGSAENGGALFVAGHVIVTSCTFDGNTADRGGAAFIAGSAEFNGCTFYQNHAAVGGAVYAGVGGLTTIVDSVFQANRATTRGGAVYAAPALIEIGMVAVHGSVIERNDAPTGAGIAADAAVLIVDGTRVSENRASRSGGGVDLISSVAEVSNGDIYANQAMGMTPAIGVRDGSSLAMTSARVRANRGANGAALHVDDDGLLEITDTVFAASSGDNIQGSFQQDELSRLYPAYVSDLASPHGRLDILDVLDFVDAIGRGHGVADFDMDHKVSVFDLLAFFDDYGTHVGT